MDKYFKRIVSFVVALTILVGSFLGGTINSYAGSVDFDDEKFTFTIKANPYGGVKVCDVFPFGRSVGIYSDINQVFSTRGSVTDVETKKKLNDDDKLVVGKKYSCKFLIYINESPYSSDKYSVVLQDEFAPNDTKFYSNNKVVKYEDHIECTCVITAKERPNLNLGDLYIDWSNLSDNVLGEEHEKELRKMLDELVMSHTIDEKDILDEKNNIYIVGIKYDLDRDGVYDLIYESNGEDHDWDFKLTDSCDFEGEHTYSLSGFVIEELEEQCCEYYENLVIKFSDIKTEETQETNENKNVSDSGSSGGSGTSNNTDNSKDAPGGSSKTNSYKNEWVNGQWYDENGGTSYTAQGTWKSDSTGWWFEDSAGWYPVSQWQKIDGKWYYFLESGYMDYSEYRDGYWLGSDGAMVDGYYGEWKSDSKGWWFEDTSGWYPQSQWLWINGKCYYFESDGYLATSKYVDGYWVGADGACQ